VTIARVVVLALVPLLAVAGCGSEDETAGSGAPETTLEITVWSKGRDADEPRVIRLECPPDASDPACTRLAELGPDAFDPVPADMACTELYGGPQEARVEGTIDGEPVEARLSRANGCEIARWDAVEAVVPVPPWDPAAG
jgi:hypothetical protein